jgi:ribonuclease BN (tRNA processing enzyme)
MIEVVFLGVGAAVPMRGQTNASYLVRAGGAAVLIDCGPAVLQQLAAVGRTPGDVTHSAALSPEVSDGFRGHSTARGAGRNAAAAGARLLALVHMDPRYEGRQDALVAEAACEFGGPVSAPQAGDSYTL